MVKPNKKVRAVMFANEVSQFQLANELGIGVGTIMRRLSAELPEETQDRIIELVEKIASGSFSGNLPQLILEDLDYDREMAERQRGVETTDTSLFEKPASSKKEELLDYEIKSGTKRGKKIKELLDDDSLLKTFANPKEKNGKTKYVVWLAENEPKTEALIELKEKILELQKIEMEETN